MRARPLGLAALLAASALIGGCSAKLPDASDGTNVSPSAAAQFDRLLRECETVTETQIKEAVGGDGYPESYFHGAVCMWKVPATGGMVDVTFAWFENGSLGHEQQTARELGYELTPMTVQGATAFSQRRPGTPPACGVAAAWDGAITWWVQGTADPCETARTLMEFTLERTV
ncbi:DUF3558 domain-containing protein [Nocardia sp. 2]|uniref:DUF3558 domain-containing protein n=1 Tax=Nocardia acididurans TaxID=2802282 RepID=A0ABS1MCD3_9NOCA|nr:DUF3558 domain-containing protein [Nocardia acididurans]MBL1078221.1 DUF3558 domain-containing protein [Nocardia acididurans]